MVSFLGFNRKENDKSVSLDVPPSLPDTTMDKNMVFDRSDSNQSLTEPLQRSNPSFESTNSGFEGVDVRTEPRKLPDGLLSADIKEVRFSTDDVKPSNDSLNGSFEGSSKMEKEEFSEQYYQSKPSFNQTVKSNPFDFYKNDEKKREHSLPYNRNQDVGKSLNAQDAVWGGKDSEESSKKNPLIRDDKASISFFKELERRFSEEKNELYSIISSGLLHKMKDYHESINNGKHFFLGNKDVDDVIYSYLLELRELESEWLIRSREFESAKNLLLEKESEIEKKLARFRNVIRNAEKFRMLGKKTTSDKAFRLQSGVMLYSVEDLLYELSKMDEEVFRHHVNEERNDFSTWIEHVFLYSELSDQIKSARNKDEMIRIIRDF